MPASFCPNTDDACPSNLTMKRLSPTLLLSSLALLCVGIFWHIGSSRPAVETGTPPVQSAPVPEVPVPAAAPRVAPAFANSPEEMERAHDRNAEATAALIATSRRMTPATAPARPTARQVTVAITESSNRQTEWEFQLAPGVHLPVALVETGESLTPAQLHAMDAMTERFLNDVTAEPPKTASASAAGNPSGKSATPAPSAADAKTEVTKRAAWDAARAGADENYRAIFGKDAFNSQNVQTARDAIGVK